MKLVYTISAILGFILIFSACEEYNTPNPSAYGYYPSGTGLIGTYGGEIYIGDSTSPIRDAVCAIKAGAITSPATFKLVQAPADITISGQPDARIIVVTPSDVSLTQMAIIGLSYRHLGTVDPLSLQIFRLIPSSGELIPLSIPNADETKKVMYGSTDQLGYFVLLADAALTVTTGTFTDTRDNKVYNWSEINGQKWMAQNLNFDASSGSWCYNDNSTSCDTYGRLYDYTTASSICPDGWHLPSHEEWKQLEAALGMTSSGTDAVGWFSQGFVGKKLKGTSGWNLSGNGTNEVQFNALPGGYRDGDATFYEAGEGARFWTSTSISGAIWTRNLNYAEDGIYWGQRAPSRAYSVRCVEGANQEIPILSTTIPASTTGFTTLTGGQISSQGGSAVSDRGVCWNTSGYPTTSDDQISLGSGSNAFNTQITGLSRETTYYIRAFAVNADGIGYGDQQIITTRSLTAETGVTTDTRDNKTYDIIQIGDDWWFAENLNFETSTGSWCYGDNASNCITYGRLYNYQTAKNACPSGWTLPSDDDWKRLEVTLGMSQSDADAEDWRHDGEVGYRLKSTSGWSQNGNGSNDSKFNILPAGFRDGDGTYGFQGDEARFWTYTIGNGGDPWVRFLEYNDQGTYRKERGGDRGMSLRCIKGQSQSTLPLVETNNPFDVTGFTAELGGEVTSEGGSSVNERGICWNTTGSPEVLDNKIIMGTGTGIFDQLVTGFTLETMYYVRAYARNSDGVSYGQELSFVTNSIVSSTDTETDSRDGKTYETVKIGNTWWLAENLNYTANNASWCYDESGSFCDDYGRLYQWQTATSICMPGWRLPSDEQWKDLERSLGMSDADADDKNWRHDGEIAVRMKSTTLWASSGNGTNDSWFNVKPGGFRDGNGAYAYRTDEARFWTSTIGSGGEPIIRFLEYNNTGVYREERGGTRAMSVRCVKGLNTALPSLTTGSPNNITGFTADISGNVLSQGGSSVIEKGFCWNTTGYPLINDNKIDKGTGSGSFNTGLTGLSLETTYYIRAYAINSDGIGYGDQETFSTSSISSVSDILEDSRDQKEYDIVLIGDKWWMADNLNFTVADGSWCYDESSSMCDDYGRLYNWETASAACPSGWELPSDSDWKTMEMALGMSEANANAADWRHDGDIAKRLKSTSGWYNSGNGINDSRMNIKPAGFRDTDGTFSYINMEARLWTDSGTSNNEAWARFLQHDDDGVYRKERGRERAMSVRCIKK